MQPRPTMRTSRSRLDEGADRHGAATQHLARTLGDDPSPGADGPRSRPTGPGAGHGRPRRRWQLLRAGGSRSTSMPAGGRDRHWPTPTAPLAAEHRAAYGDAPVDHSDDVTRAHRPDIPHPADDPTLHDPTLDDPTLHDPTLDDPDPGVLAAAFHGADAPHPAHDPTLEPDSPLALEGLHDATLGTVVDAATQVLHRLREVVSATQAGPAHIDELLRLLGAMDAGNAAVMGLTGQLQSERLVLRTTGLSFASLLACQSPLPTTDHRRLLRNTLILRSMPHLADAVATGRVPAAVLPSILPELRRLKVAQRHDIDAAFASDGLLAPLAPDELIDAVRDAVTLLRPEVARDDEQRAFNQRMLSFTPHDEGWLSGYFELDAEAGAALLEAVDAAAPPPASGPNDVTKHAIDGRSDTPPAPDSWEWRSRNRQRAEGLVRLAESYLGGTDPDRTPTTDERGILPEPSQQQTPAGSASGAEHTAPRSGRDVPTSDARPVASSRPRGRRPRPKLLVLADIATLIGDDANAQAARLLWRAASGPIRLTPDAVRRLASDADLRLVLHDDGVVLGTSAPTATIPAPLRDAVHARDQGCRFPSCRAPVHWCDLHHVRPRHAGGPTTADNLTALCRRHHTAVTTGRWRLTMTADGVISVRRGRYTATSLPPHRRRLLPPTRPDPPA